MPAGFRYGFGENGAGGCAYWEQCAQWQSFQDYPNECFDQDAHYAVWLKNHHRHFNHEFMRYAATGSSIGLLKSMASSHTPVSGKKANILRILQTYMRIYCNNSLDASTRICMRIVLIVLTMISRLCISIRRRLPLTILPNCIRTMATIRWFILTAGYNRFQSHPLNVPVCAR